MITITDSAAPAPVAFYQRPPGWVFHALVGLFVAGLLWSTTIPGGSFPEVMFGVAGLLLAGVVWFGRLFAWTVLLARDRAVGNGLVFLVAPCLVVTASILSWLDAPMQWRWSLARGEFAEVVEAAVSLPDGAPTTELSGHLGTYTIDDVRVAGDAVVFSEASGAFFGDAGFAYIPEGSRRSVGSAVRVDPSDSPWGGLVCLHSELVNPSSAEAVTARG